MLNQASESPCLFQRLEIIRRAIWNHANSLNEIQNLNFTYKLIVSNPYRNINPMCAMCCVCYLITLFSMPSLVQQSPVRF